ncbi:MAG: MaoC family dehydratase [Alphaproteobacteria bacterium]|jgi:acyl dehydratase|nr:MaoC family dehydratase [Alphaproteobacteria bacterium]
MSEAEARPWRGNKVPEQRYFEDFEIGERFLNPSRTQTDALFAAFQLASGDNHPIHYDVEYCRSLGFPGLLAHGLQVLIQAAPGAGDFPFVVQDSLKAVVEVSAKFKAPVFSGDTTYPMLEVVGLESGRTTGVVVLRSTVHNQRDELCMDGEIKTLLKRRNPVA